MYGQTTPLHYRPITLPTQHMSPVREAEVAALRAQVRRLEEIIRAYRVTLAEFSEAGVRDTPNAAEGSTDA